jgi:hypothetical protein
MDRQQPEAQPASRTAGFSMPKTQKSEISTPESPKNPGISEVEASFLTETPLVPVENVEKLADEAAKTMEETAEVEENADPALAYVKRLEENGLSLPKALAIIDDLAVKGRYSEDIALTPRVKITLATRSTRFNSYLADKVDIANPQKVGKLNQLMTEYQVAASLDRYATTAMPPLGDDLTEEQWTAALEQRLQHVRRLPSPIFLAIVNHLARFDSRMIIIFSDGYEKNF